MQDTGQDVYESCICIRTPINHTPFRRIDHVHVHVPRVCMLIMHMLDTIGSVDGQH